MSLAALLLGVLVGVASRVIPTRVVADQTALAQRVAVATAVVVAGCVVAWATGLLVDPAFVLGLLTGMWVIPVAVMLAQRSRGHENGRPR